jgi:predicted hydrolase (HD superfamily)
MLSAEDADVLVSQYLAATPRAIHTRFVAYLMRQLAGTFAADADLWEVVGLCHDLDFFQTCDNRNQHGLLTVQWLGDRLPAEAHLAIASHDHRTGVQADTLLADALKIADVLAVIDARLGRNVLREVNGSDTLAALRSRLLARAYLCDMLERYTKKHGLSVSRMIDIVVSSSLPSH